MERDMGCKGAPASISCPLHIHSNMHDPRAAVLRSFAASTINSFGSGAVTIGILAAIRSMLTDTSVGHALAMSAVVIAGLNTVGFAITALTRSHKVTDLTPSNSLFLTAMVSIWGTRLAGFLFSRILQMGEHPRLHGFFPKNRNEPLITGASRFPLKLAGFWATQGLWAWVVCLPVTVAHAIMAGGGLMTPVAWVGALAWTVGLSWEATSDYQKSAFKKDPANKGRFCDTGLFALSQHPNYFGEILLWTGVYITAGFPVLWARYPWIATSPGFTALLLLFVSGVPVTEVSQHKRYGADQRFKEYQATTNLLIPGPKRATKNQ